MKCRSTPFVSWPSAILSTFVALLLLSATPASSTPLNTSISTPRPLHAAPYCTSSVDWILPSFSPNDCTEAFQAFTYGDYLRYGTTRFEFHNRVSPQRTRLKSMRTPRRYTIGKCTVAIAILEDYWPLPGMPGEKMFSRTDVASFREVFESVRRIELTCVTSAQPCGWEPVGKEGSLGVFMYAVDSAFDLFVKFGEDMAALKGSALKGVGNGTLGGNESTS